MNGEDDEWFSAFNGIYNCNTILSETKEAIKKYKTKSEKYMIIASMLEAASYGNNSCQVTNIHNSQLLKELETLGMVVTQTYSGAYKITWKNEELFNIVSNPKKNPKPL
jgi:spore coat protein CotF